jgi:uncharacterized protein
MIKTILTAAAALVIAACGGIIFFLIHAPLPWTLGALTAAGLIAAFGGRWLVPMQARTGVRPIIGVVAGSAFTAEIATAILNWWSAILIVIVYAIVLLLFGLVFFRKAARFDATTAFFASAPGGLGELSLIGGQLGADVRRLVVVHATRVLFVVFSIPFALQILLGEPIGRTVPTLAAEVVLSGTDWMVLAACAIVGYVISRFVKFPGGGMVFPLILSMAVHVSGITQAAPPAWLVAVVQIVLGAVVGARFAGIKWHEARKFAFVAAIWAVVTISASALLAVVGTWVLDYPFETMLLALAPAGFVEMTLITYAIGGDVAFVLTCQLCRILFVLLMTPVFFRLLGIAPKTAAD